MFDLSAQIASKPIMDEPYRRHLRTADVFNEVQEARENARKAEAALEAAIAKAAIMQSLEDL